MNTAPTAREIAQRIDVSAVQAQDTSAAVQTAVEVARKYRCKSVITLPGWMELAGYLLADDPDVFLGGCVGFPSGGATTASKVFETREQVEYGAKEIDMMINLGKFLSEQYAEVKEDIRAVVECAWPRPVKVILECHYLNSDQIRTGCDILIEAGAQFVKTGTGWAPSGATLERVALIKAHVENALQIKAAGGVRDLDSLLEMARLGAGRFGMSASSVDRMLGQPLFTSARL